MPECIQCQRTINFIRPWLVYVPLDKAALGLKRDLWCEELSGTLCDHCSRQVLAVVDPEEFRGAQSGFGENYSDG